MRFFGDLLFGAEMKLDFEAKDLNTSSTSRILAVLVSLSEAFRNGRQSDLCPQFIPTNEKDHHRCLQGM